MSNAAQEEFNALFSDKTNGSSRHPEDEADKTDSEPEPLPETFPEKDSDDEDDSSPANMRSKYYLPRMRSEANTGPKGVIADAQAFEDAKRVQRYSTKAKETNIITIPSNNNWRGSTFLDAEKDSDEEDEDGFLSRWRQERLKEYQNVKARIRSRTTSPNRRLYGSLTTVDADGYLDAIEKVAKDTVVVVFIYDDMSDISIMVESCVRKLAKQHATTRFVKLHYEEAEMEPAGVPALLAYRGGDKFAGLVPIVDELPDDADLSDVTLGAVMKRHGIL